jgi:hypothetical protein
VVGYRPHTAITPVSGVTVLYKPHVISMPLESGDNRPEHTVHKPLILFCQCSYQFGVQLWAAHTTPSLLLLDGGGGGLFFPSSPSLLPEKFRSFAADAGHMG